MPAALLSARALALRAALYAQRSGALTSAAAAASASAQARELHVSSALQARRKARGSAASARQPATSAVFDGPPSSLAHDDDEDEDFERWAGKMTVRSAARRRSEDKESVQDLVPIEIEGEDDEDMEQDEETQEFLSHVDELFSLAPNEFEKRMKTTEKREAAARRPAKRRGEAGDDYDEDEDEESDRVKERISKKKLLKALDELSPTKSKKNLEGMPMVRTAAKSKMAAPLEKNVKNNAEKASFRQARVELTVVDFVQNLLLEQSDTMGIDVIPSFVEASVSPDLRRIILFWEPVRLNSDNQVISKRKVAGIDTRLGKQERWVRAQVTRFLNLKYSPIIEFKQRKAHKSDEARALFDSEMQWLDRFK